MENYLSRLFCDLLQLSQIIYSKYNGGLQVLQAARGRSFISLLAIAAAPEAAAKVNDSISPLMVAKFEDCR